MRAEQRWQAITGWLEESGRLDVAETAQRLAVAPETVRRDLRRLEADGRLQRVHGGAVRVAAGAAELPPGPCWPATAHEVTDTEAWARELWARLRCVETMVLGGGPTVLALVRAIVADPPAAPGLTLLSGSLDASLLLAPVPELAVLHLGGAVSSATAEGHPVSGDWTLSELARIQADVCVVGPAGIDLERGLSEPGTAAAALCRAQLRAGRRAIALVSGPALLSGALVTVADLGCVDELVFATDPAPEVSARLSAALRDRSGRSRAAPEFL